MHSRKIESAIEFANGLVLMVSALASFFFGGLEEEGLRIFIRLTAGQATLLFVAVLVGAPLESRVPNGWTRLLATLSPVLLKATALSMLAHLLALVLLALAFPEPFRSTLTPLALAAGGLAYILLFVIAFTPKRFALRASDSLAWRRIQAVGFGFIWIIFVRTYFLRSAEEPTAIFFLVLLGLSALLRGTWAFRNQPDRDSR